MNIGGHSEMSKYELFTVTMISGSVIGMIHVFGPLPQAGIILLTMAAIIAMFKKTYHCFVLAAILLMSCVIIEPSPTDLIFCALIPLGLLTGSCKPDIREKALYAVLFLFAFFIVSLPGIALSFDQFGSLRFYSISFYLFLVAVFICSYANKMNITSLLRAYLFAAILAFLAGLAGYLGFYQELLMSDSFRVKGLFKDPNVFGTFFIPAIIILSDDIIRKTILKTHTALYIILMASLSLGVIFSFSRAAWINLLVSMLVYFTINIKEFRQTKKIRIIVAILIVFALLICLLLSPLMSASGIADFLKYRAKPQDYDTSRFRVQQGGIELSMQNPFGYGPGQFEKVIVRITKSKLSAHSLYIRILAENGFLGFLLFFAGLGYILIQLFFLHYKTTGSNDKKADSFTSDSSLIPAVPLAVLTGILVNSIVVDTLHWRHFWFFIGIGLYCLKEKKEVPCSQ